MIATESEIEQVEALGLRWAALVHREQELEAARPVAKLEAIRRIMGTENEDTGKPHSYSSAEKAVETDPEYSGYLKTVRDVVLEKNTTYAKLDAARLRAKLGVALAGVGA